MSGCVIFKTGEEDNFCVKEFVNKFSNNDNIWK
jgi:hypothetical protein